MSGEWSPRTTGHSRGLLSSSDRDQVADEDEGLARRNRSTGAEFDSSWNRGTPLQFPLGAGRVIAGWDQGVQGMKVGGRRQLTIPPHLGYGDRGAGGAIAPGETLIFVCDLVSV